MCRLHDFEAAIDQESTDHYQPKRELNALVLRGCIHSGKRRVLDDQHIDYREGVGAIWWPPILLLVGLVGWMVVAQLAKVL